MARPPRCRHDRQGALALAVLLLAGVAACAAHAQPEGAEAAAAAGAEAAQAAQAAQAATAVAGAAGSPSSAPSPPRSVSLGITEALGAWAESQPSGAALLAAELEVAEFPGMGVGMKAAAPLAAASALVDVPFSMVMSQSSAADSNIGPIIVGLSDKPGANHAMLLALHLLYERAVGAASPFKAFIDTLPGKVGLPMAWDPAMRKAELGGTRLEEQVEEQVAQVLNEYEQVVKPLFDEQPEVFPPEHFGLEGYVWALEIVLSRSMVLAYDDVTLPVLVPVVELFNHDHVSSEAVANHTSGRFTVTAGRDYTEGEQVFVNSRPRRGNLALMVLGGFALPNNPFDLAEVRFGLDVGRDLLGEQRVKLLASMLGAPEAGAGAAAGEKYFRLQFARGTLLPPAALAAARVMALRPSELDAAAGIAQGRRVSLENELAAHRWLLAAIQARLKRYASTVAEDDARLQTPVSKQQAFATLYRRGEKAALMDASANVAENWGALLLEGFDTAPAPAASRRG